MQSLALQTWINLNFLYLKLDSDPFLCHTCTCIHSHFDLKKTCIGLANKPPILDIEILLMVNDEVVNASLPSAAASHWMGICILQKLLMWIFYLKRSQWTVALKRCIFSKTKRVNHSENLLFFAFCASSSDTTSF